MENKEPFDPYLIQKFSDGHCFLCGTELKPGDTGSREHVFPRWLQNRYDLWNQYLGLPNGTHIPYRQLTIPCCTICNNEYLGRIEQEIQDGLEGGPEAFNTLDEKGIFQWLSKIFYGILFKELSLLVDRRNPQEGTITTPNLLEEMNTLHGFLQSVRHPIKFEANHPWSIFIFQCHDYNDFHYDNLSQLMVCSIRMDGVGIVACLEDNGILKEWFTRSYEKFREIKLHPLQFDEWAARVAYQAMLLNRPTKSITIMSEDDDVMVVSPSLRGYNDATVFGPENNELKKRIFSRYWQKYGIMPDEVFREPDMFLTFLYNEDNSIKLVDAEGMPIQSEK